MENNHILSLNNGLNGSEVQRVFPTSFGGEEDPRWGSELFFKGHTGMEAITGQFDQNFVSATEVENMNTDGNGAGFVGLGSHEFGAFQDHIAGPLVYRYDPLQQLIKTGMQAHSNEESLNQTMNVYMQDRSSNYSMTTCENDKIYTVQPQMIFNPPTLIPSNTNSPFMFGSVAPPDYY